MKEIYSLGIDPSFNGFSAILLQNNQIIDFYFFSLFNEYGKYANDFDEIHKVNEVLDPFLRYISKLNIFIDVIGIEKPIFNRFNPKIFAEQMMLYYALTNHFCCRLDLCTYRSEPKGIKKFFTGSGNSNKEDMLLACLKYKDYKSFPELKNCLKQEKNKKLLKKEQESYRLKREGLVDAIAIALYAKNQYNILFNITESVK